jgi:hypothetical protein
LNWQQDNDQVQSYGATASGQNKVVDVPAFSFVLSVPTFPYHRNWAAVEDNCKLEEQPVSESYGDSHVYKSPKLRLGEDAEIHEQERKFGKRSCRPVHDLTDPLYLLMISHARTHGLVTRLHDKTNIAKR